MELLTGREDLLVLFAAQTLKHKLVYDWRQLDEAAVLGLRERLWSMLLPTAQVPRNVAVQLRLALAALIVQIDARLWADPVADLFRCAAGEGGAMNDDMLQLLTLIPEQLKNPAIRFPSSDAFYGCCERLLEQHVDVVIQMLLRRLGSLEDSQLALTCLLSWIQYGGNGSRLIESAEFLQGIFGLLKRALAEACGDDDGDVDEQEIGGLVETCCGLLIELCERLSGRLDDDFEVEDSSEAAAHGQAWFDRMNSAWNPVLAHELSTLPLAACLSRSFLQRPLVTLVAEASQIFLDQLMHGFPAEFHQICRALLTVVESPACPVGVVELTFPFFSLLPSFLNDWEQDDGDDLATDSGYKQLYSALLRTLLTRHLPFPSHCSPEEVDKFRELRHVIGDTLKDCVRVLGASDSLALLAPILTDPSVSWQGREAALFALRAISSAVDPRESEVMPQISAQLNVLLTALLASPHPIGVRKPVSAVLLNVGCYAEWLRYHADHLPGHLQLIGESLKYALSASASAVLLESALSIISSACQSLKYVAQSVAGLLGRHYDALEEIYLTCTASPLLGRLERLDLTEAVCLVLVRRAVGLPGGDEEFCRALQRILAPIWMEARWDAYAVALESLLLPELPRTPLIFARFVVPSVEQLLQSLASCGEDEAKLEAWLRCLTAALNNGTAGAVEEMIRGRLLPWLSNLGNSTAPQEAMVMALLSTLIAGRFLSTADDQCLSCALSLLSRPFPGQASESWCCERFNLLRVLLLHYPALPVCPLLEQSHTFALLQEFLRPGRPCSAAEIAALTGFLSVLIAGSLDDEKCVGAVEWSLGAMTERVLKEWPLQHCHDLATVLCRAARFEGLRLRELMSAALRTALTETTPTELRRLEDEFEEAVGEAKRGGRGRRMRVVVKDLAELARRRS